MVMELPKSRDEIAAIQSERKRLAFERAKRAAWYQGKLDHIDPDRLDDPEVWQSIPIIDKDTLRQWSHDEFLKQINVAEPHEISEYWRSGGSTGAGRPRASPRCARPSTASTSATGRAWCT